MKSFRRKHAISNADVRRQHRVERKADFFGRHARRAVKVRAQDRHGEWFELEAGDLLGRCIQHENDHLDGITIMQSSEYFYEDTEEGKKAAREAKGNN
mgnify:CR=1 FL=1